jgi:nitroreductase
VELDYAIRTRRTHKTFGPEPVSREVLEELFELARWAPNHHVSNPWRFRVLGASTRRRLKLLAEVAKPGSASKLDRAPTLIAVTARSSGDPVQDREDLLASAVAAYIILLGAHGRGLAGYWRTVSVLEGPAGRALLGIEEDERVLGLLHLGPARQPQRIPERAPTEQIVTYLD